jgi:hypothetical protein
MTFSFSSPFKYAPFILIWWSLRFRHAAIVKMVQMNMSFTMGAYPLK